MNDLAKVLVYPAIAQEKGIKGRIVVRMMLDKEGNLIGTEITQSVPELDAAAIAAVRKLKKMLPAIQNGKTVESAYLLPITFNLY